MSMTYEQIKDNATIQTYIAQADKSLAALGFTEHSFAHVTRVAEMAGYILTTMGHEPRTVEVAKIAGYLHDIGNLVNRVDHSQSGAVMASVCWTIWALTRRKSPPSSLPSATMTKVPACR